MSESLEQEIVALQDLHGSSRDPNGRAFVPLADAYRRAGRLDEALDLLREGLTRHPEYVSAHVVASWLHIERGALDEALGTLELILELDKDNRAGLKGMGQVLHERGDREGALEHLSHLAELEPEDAEAKALLDTIQAAEPAPIPETAAVEETVSEPPEIVVDDFEPTVADEAPDVAVAEPEVAEPEVAEPEVAGAPTPPHVGEDVITRTMADVYADQGLTAKAIDVYQQLVAADPDDAELEARLWELREEAAAPLAPAVEDVAVEPEPVPVETLAPEAEDESPPVSIDALAPDAEAPAVDDRPVSPIESLAPEGERPVVLIAMLAPGGDSAAAG